MINKGLYNLLLLLALCCIFSVISFSAKAQHSFIQCSFTGGPSKYDYFRDATPEAGTAFMSSIRYGAYIIPDILYICTGPSVFSLTDQVTQTDYNNPVGGISKVKYTAEGIAHMAGVGLSIGKHAVRFVAGGDFSFNLYNYKTQFERKNGIGLWPHADLLFSLGKMIKLGVTGQAGFFTSPNKMTDGQLKANYIGGGINLWFVFN